MKILIVEVNWLGDVLFSTAAIRALRGKFPESYISCLVVPGVREVVEGNPYIDEIIINDEAGVHRGLWGRLKLINELRGRKFDLAVFFHRSFSRAAVVYLAGVTQRIGYDTWKRHFLLTQPLAMAKKDSLHRVDHYLRIVEPLGCDISRRRYDFFVSQSDIDFARRFLRDEGINDKDFLVCLNPGGNWPPKRWPKESFSLLADRLIREYKFKIIFSGSQNDCRLVNEIIGNMREKAIIAAGKATLKQSAALFQRMNLVISADSGPLHIAASMGVEVIALFGPTSKEITGPIGKGRITVIQRPGDCHIPCYESGCGDNRCMRAITVEEVLARVKKSAF